MDTEQKPIIHVLKQALEVPRFEMLCGAICVSAIVGPDVVLFVHELSTAELIQHQVDRYQMCPLCLTLAREAVHAPV